MYQTFEVISNNLWGFEKIYVAKEVDKVKLWEECSWLDHTGEFYIFSMYCHCLWPINKKFYKLWALNHGILKRVCDVHPI